MAKRKYLAANVLFLLLISIPYIYAWLKGGDGYVFGGFLLNPLDGNSYLAKMQQGAMGSWLFTLPFTSETGQAHFLFIFYILLGHLAQLFHLSGLLVFHFVRLASAIFLLFALRGFLEVIFKDRPENIWKTYLFLLFGSGMGWIAAGLGYFTSDFWVAEAYPFLAAYANPHFPLGIALLLVAFKALLEQTLRWWSGLLLGLAIALTLPFALVVGCAVGGLWWLVQVIQRRKVKWLGEFFFGLGGGCVLVYQYWATLTDPLLSVWNLQNQTPAPELLDLLFSFSPILILAIVGVIHLIRTKTWKQYDLVIVWAGISFLMLLLPFNLQRRFLTGICIPLAILGVTGLSLAMPKKKINRLATIFLFAFSLPTNVLILSTALFAAQTHDPQIYLTRGESDALAWVQENTAPGDVVLASDRMGMYIPAQTGRKVVYGHPFETIDAQVVEEQVAAYFQDQMQNPGDFLSEHSVDYVMVSDAEGNGLPPGFSLEPPVYQNTEIRIYLINEED